MSKYGLRVVVIAYLLAILAAPLGYVYYETFAHDASKTLHSLTGHDTVHAFKITMLAVLIAVPLNTIFGITCALAIVRRRFPGKGLVNAFVDLPLALSPVVVGFSLYLLYGVHGWFGHFFLGHGIQVLFAWPSIVLATIFVSVPFVAREVIPTLRELGDEQEKAAYTLGASGWQTFWRITLPTIRWAVIYGVVLTSARCLGEYGAVAVVSGNIEGKTQTATLVVDEKYTEYDLPGAYGVALALAAIAIVVLILMTTLRPKEGSA